MINIQTFYHPPPLSISKDSFSPWYRWQQSTALWFSDDHIASYPAHWLWRLETPCPLSYISDPWSGIKSQIPLPYVLSMHRFLNSRCSIIAHQCNGIINKDFSILEFELNFRAENSNGCWVLTHSKERGWTLLTGCATGGLKLVLVTHNRRWWTRRENKSVRISLKKVVSNCIFLLMLFPLLGLHSPLYTRDEFQLSFKIQLKCCLL